MRKLGILVVDDSPFVRELLTEFISCEEDMQVVGAAENGKEACTLAEKLKPDLITMDITMPVMNGLEAIEEIMANYPVPILVLTSVTDANTAYEAIAKGALEVFRKPKLNKIDSAAFINKIRSLAKIKVIRHLKTNRRTIHQVPAPAASTATSTTASIYQKVPPHIVIGIASSTGGPKALAEILNNLPGDLPASIIIAQHIGGHFSKGLVRWLNTLSPMKIKTAALHEPVMCGTVYIAPDGQHITLGDNHCINLENSHNDDLYTPSANKLLSSLAHQCKDTAVGIILSGMGSDGVDGICLIKKSQGRTIAQNQQTCIVYGMPKAAVKSGCIDHILPLPHIAKKIISLANNQKRAMKNG